MTPMKSVDDSEEQWQNHTLYPILQSKVRQHDSTLEMEELKRISPAKKHSSNEFEVGKPLNSQRVLRTDLREGTQIYPVNSRMAKDNRPT